MYLLTLPGVRTLLRGVVVMNDDLGLVKRPTRRDNARSRVELGPLDAWPSFTPAFEKVNCVHHLHANPMLVRNVSSKAQQKSVVVAVSECNSHTTSRSGRSNQRASS
jgi:hypothetical protein